MNRHMGQDGRRGRAVESKAEEGGREGGREGGKEGGFTWCSSTSTIFKISSSLFRAPASISCTTCFVSNTLPFLLASLPSSGLITRAKNGPVTYSGQEEAMK